MDIFNSRGRIVAEKQLPIKQDTMFNYHWRVEGEVILSHLLNLVPVNPNVDACGCEAVVPLPYKIDTQVVIPRRYVTESDVLTRVKLNNLLSKYYLIGEWGDYKITFVKRTINDRKEPNYPEIPQEEI